METRGKAPPQNPKDHAMPDNDWTKSPCYSIDPFPDVAPSLLNSVDIIRYAKMGCLVHPFSSDKDLLNPATYTIRLLGTLHSWEQKGGGLCKRVTGARDKMPVTIKANSISYLLTQEEFRLPQYIAARFNLHIRYVHKGILLGTGPLVDPGFVGRLLVPLHNLTNNDYEVQGGDKLLWVEFTKLTRHCYWLRSQKELEACGPKELVPLDLSKLRIDASRYFWKAGVSEKGGVLSAFKGALEDAREKANTSEKAAERSEKMVRWLGGVGVLIVIIGVGALLLAAWQLWQGNVDMANRIHDRLDRIERETGLLPPTGNGSSTQHAGEIGVVDRRSTHGPDGAGEDKSDDDAVENGNAQAGSPSAE